MTVADVFTVLTTFIVLLVVLCISATMQSDDADPNQFPVHQCNVKNYGAVGDGSVDDTAALRDAMSSCKKIAFTGRRLAQVYFPPGEYRIVSDHSETDVVLSQECDRHKKHAAVSIQGAISSTGIQASIIWEIRKWHRYSDGVQRIFLQSTHCADVSITNLQIQVRGTDEPSQVSILKFIDGRHIVVRNLRFQTQVVEGGLPYGTAISLADSSYITIENTTIEDVSSQAILLANCSNVLVSSSTISSDLIDDPDDYFEPIAAIVIKSGDRLRFESLFITDTIRGISFANAEDVPNSVSIVPTVITASISNSVFVDNHRAAVMAFAPVAVALTITDCNFTRTDSIPLYDSASTGIWVRSSYDTRQQFVNVSRCMFRNLTGNAITTVMTTLSVQDSVFENLRIQPVVDLIVKREGRTIELRDDFLTPDAHGIDFYEDRLQTGKEFLSLNVERCTFENNDQDLRVSAGETQVELLDNTCKRQTPSGTLDCSRESCIRAAIITQENNRNCKFGNYSEWLVQHNKNFIFDFRLD